MYVTSYAIALGSNRSGQHGRPEDEVRAAIDQLRPVTVSPIVVTAPLGPSIRRFANAVAIIERGETPDAVLRELKGIERAFGRRRGERWGARVIDLDIILWSGGAWTSDDLTIPHVAFRERDFVLRQLEAVAPAWRDPVSGLSVRQLRARLTRRRALP